MEMTTPVFTRREKSQGEKMDMTTPVITRRVRVSSHTLLLQNKHPVTFDFVILCFNSIFFNMVSYPSIL